MPGRRTYKVLAQELGVSYRQMLYLKKQPGAPGSMDLGEWEEWRQQQAEEEGDDISGEGQALLAALPDADEMDALVARGLITYPTLKLRAQAKAEAFKAKRAETESLEASGRLVDRKQVAAAANATRDRIWEQLKEVPQTVPREMTLNGKQRRELTQVLKRQLSEAVKRAVEQATREAKSVGR